MLAASSNVYNPQQSIQQGEALFDAVPLSHRPTSPAAVPRLALPAYIKPLPIQFGHDDITYLRNKGALAIPDAQLRNELLRAYAEHMHPFMPLLDWYKFMQIINQNDGIQSVSLLLFQAVMFTGVATVDMRLLRAAGYDTRREARRAFFEKARLLYDLDYEDDSIALIQALLLMTYWREDPNGRKETHHWIEIAVSLSQKIGLYHTPEESPALEPWQRKLRKRIWWSAYVRDAQIALSTRKPTLIRDVNFNVPMLELADFELDPVSKSSYYIPTDWTVMRNVENQRQLAIMCIEMTKLYLCLSYILSVQYGVTGTKGSARTAIMLFGEKHEPNGDQIQAGAKALQEWKRRLPEAAQYITPSLYDVDLGNGCLVVNRSFLHMVYYAVLSSLHRSQLPPSTGVLPLAAHSTRSEVSREAVRLAATEIAAIASTLYDLDLVRYLPSSSITILLPAIVANLAEVLAPGESLRNESLQNFSKCMQIMAALRDMYPAADYSTGFLQVAVQSTEIGPMTLQTDADRRHRSTITSAQGASGNRLRVPSATPNSGTGQLAPPPTNQVMHSWSLPHNGNVQTPNGLRLNYSPVSTSSATGWQFDQMQHVDHIIHYSDDVTRGAVEAADDGSAKRLTASNGATTINHVDDFELDFARTREVDPKGKTVSIEQDITDAVQAANDGFLLDTDWLMDLGAEGSMSIGEETGSARF